MGALFKIGGAYIAYKLYKHHKDKDTSSNNQQPYTGYTQAPEAYPSAHAQRWPEERQYVDAPVYRESSIHREAPAYRESSKEGWK